MPDHNLSTFMFKLTEHIMKLKHVNEDNQNFFN
jgi:hypothetical protein